MYKDVFAHIIKERKKQNRLILIAHRGLSSLASDNSVEAIKLACEKKYCDGVEFDLQETLDGQLIVRHNKTIVSGGKRLWIKDVSLVEIRRYENMFLVPRFQDILDPLKNSDKIIDIEIKSPGIAKKIISICKKNQIYERVVFSSIYSDIHKEIEGTDGKVARIFGYPRDRGKDLAQQKYLAPVVKLVIKFLRARLKMKIEGMMRQSNTNFISLYHKVLSREVVDEIHKNAGLCLGVTISLHGDVGANESRSVMEQMLENGVDAIKTDYPQLF